MVLERRLLFLLWICFAHRLHDGDGWTELARKLEVFKYRKWFLMTSSVEWVFHCLIIFYCKWGCFEAENIFFSWTELKEKFRIKVFMKSFHELELCHKINKHWLLLSNTKALVWKENQWNLLKCFQVTISRLISVTNEKVSTRHSRFEIIHFR